MKRSPQLTPLAREHNRALSLARRAERAAAEGDDPAVARTWREVTAVFDAELEPHFAVEDRHLVPALDAVGETEVAERLRRDHRVLRALRTTTAPRTRELLADFGRLLHDHVRYEDRVAFVRAEARLDTAALDAIEAASGG